MAFLSYAYSRVYNLSFKNKIFKISILIFLIAMYTAVLAQGIASRFSTIKRISATINRLMSDLRSHDKLYNDFSLELVVFYRIFDGIFDGIFYSVLYKVEQYKLCMRCRNVSKHIQCVRWYRIAMHLKFLWCRAV